MEHTGVASQDRAQVLAQRVSAAHEQTKAYVSALATSTALALPVTLMLAADFATTAATAQSTKLSFAVLAGEAWDVEVWSYAGCSSVNGMKYAVDCPAGSVLLGELESSSTNTAVANWTTQTLSASTLSAATHVGATSTPRPDRINARVKVAAAGFITLQVCSVTAATTTTLTGKSYMRAFRVTEV